MAKKKAELKATVIGGNLNIRKGASLDAKVIGVLEDGTEFEYESVDGDWLKLKKGFCMKKFTTASDS